MAIRPEQIDLWRSVPSEDPRLEFKEAKNQYDNDKLYGYCVAIANDGGGHLILGVANTPPREIVGTRAFSNPIAMAEKIFHKLGFRVDVEEVQHPSGRVLVFQIPSRPLGTAYHLDGKYLMRCGEQLVPMSEDQLRRIFKEGEPDWLEEHSKTGLSAQQVLDLLDTDGFLQLLHLPPKSDSASVIDGLRQERLVDDELTGFAIRRLGALLMAKDLRQFDDLRRKAPRVLVYAQSSKIETTQIDRTMTKGYAVGFQELVRFVGDRLPQNEVIEEAIRKKVQLVPDIVVRELIANALIHQDFTIGGTSVMIEIYPNRFEVSNPGLPVVPVERFIDGYQSRNERLADLMRRMGICEEKSSGIDRVVHCAEVYQLPAPDFTETHQRTLVVVAGPQPFEDMDRDARIRACYQHCALKWVMSGHMTNRSLRERFHLPESKSVNVSQVIATTVEARLIKPDQRAGDSRRLARYLPFWA